MRCRGIAIGPDQSFSKVSVSYHLILGTSCHSWYFISFLWINLRRDAFDFIEAIRNEKFGKNVTKISKVWRSYRTRRYYFYLLSCVVRIQCLFRRASARIQTTELMKAFMEYLRLKEASRKISRCYRNHYALQREGADLREKKGAIVKIQGTMRGRLARKQVFFTVLCIIKMQSILRTIRRRKIYEKSRSAVVKIQCFGRMTIAKYRTEEVIQDIAATKIQSMAKMRCQYLIFKRQQAAASQIKASYRRHLYQECMLYGTFLKRYYMLGDPLDFKQKTNSGRKKVMLARHRNAIINNKREQLFKLVNKLVLDSWQPGLFESFSHKGKDQDAPQALMSFARNIVCPPQAISNDLISIPQNKDDFLSRTLPSRLCLTGMQLCHGFVFLRAATYAHLEETRNSIVAGSSTRIQAAARRRLVIEDLRRKRTSAIKVQSVIRMVFTKRKLVPMKEEFAATLIQSMWRMSATKKSVWNQYWSTQRAELFGKICDSM